MDNKLIVGIIGLVVGLTMTFGLLGPIITDAQEQTGTPNEFTNSTYNSYVGTYDIVKDFTIEDSNKVNGLALVDSASTANRLVFADTFYVTYRSTGSWQIISNEDGYTAKTGTDTLTCTTSNNVAVFSSTSLGEYRIAYTIAYAFAGEDGEYIINSSFSHNTTAYANNIDSFFVSTGQTIGEDHYFVTLQNGVVKSGSTIGTVTYNEDKIDGMMDAVTISDLVANVNGADVNLAILLVPATVIGHSASTTSTIIGIIPLLVIVVMVVFVAGFIQHRRLN